MKKHSVTLYGHRTSITLEDEFWQTLKDIAAHQGMSLASIIQAVDEKRGLKYNLSSALRVYVLKHYQEKNA